MPLTIEEIGCCGAYCGTCKARSQGTCRGCKLGYDTGDRDISKARCWIKRCCFVEKKLRTCADCPDPCEKLEEWYGKGPKYSRYRLAIEYIRDHGYDAFLEKADRWKDAKGKL